MSNQHLNVNDINRLNSQMMDSNGALSVIYVDLDEQTNDGSSSTATKTIKEMNMPPPPTYHELFRSRTVDRLPTYNSFRQKLSRLTKQQQQQQQQPK